MYDPEPLYRRLLPLRGRRVRYQSCDFTVLEVLDEPYALVLEALDDKVIQADRHGNPCRRTQRTITLALLAPSGERANPLLDEVGVIEDGT